MLPQKLLKTFAGKRNNYADHNYTINYKLYLKIEVVQVDSKWMHISGKCSSSY